MKRRSWLVPSEIMILALIAAMMLLAVIVTPH